PGLTMRLIVLPQALRVIIPPVTSQYLNLTKNSSLAVIIGYPDLVSIANTSINQTGQAVEGIALIMAVYLVISLTISLSMNLYNRAVALVER
ncbi:MAG: amino acid ABC transporter permease, partial [Stellaceae bacterium]